MKFRPVYQSARVLVFSALLFGSACKKNINGSSPDAAAASLSDSSTVADNAFNDVFLNAFFGYSDEMLTQESRPHDGSPTVNGTAKEENSIRRLSCAHYTLETTGSGGYPKTLTLDFEDSCSGSVDGILRKGKIIYVFTGNLLTPGTTVSASFDHYFVNGYGLEGSCSIENTSDSSAIRFTSSVTNGIFTFPDLTNFHYSGTKTISLAAGGSTPFNFLDDVYSITGNSNFSASDGSSLVSKVTTPLTRTITCPFISSGVISFTYNGNLNGTIDFGDGDCDAAAALAVGSITRTITLR